MSGLNKRLNAYRPDLADERLQGLVQAERYSAGETRRIVASATSVRRQPSRDSMQLTQALYGEDVQVLDIRDGFAWVRLHGDGYVGYMDATALGDVTGQATHEVITPSTMIYPKPDIKSSPAIIIPMLSRLMVVGQEKDFLVLATGGYVYARHARPLAPAAGGDHVTVAQRFLFTPYFWGGKTVHGIDCSGLVQVALQAVGQAVLRDSDMQEHSLGTPLSAEDARHLQRGDFVFWDGHVGMMVDSTTLLHANGFYMMVTEEPLAEAMARIAKPVTAYKRLQ
jgi:prepilin-type processing-associated H-X9-DG protein